MNYIILDLEATCWRSRQGRRNEIIEIGAVKVNSQGSITDEFVTFVQPVLEPTLSEFCTELTTIRQADVDGAPKFPEALEDFLNWIGPNPYTLASWGFYDRQQFLHDCKVHDLETDWVQPHVSLKHQYTNIVGARRHMGMTKALKREGFQLDGTHHRGIDDARNIAKIFLQHFDRWTY